MVDALREIWRGLSANGILVDLRPLHSSSCPIEVVTPEEAVKVGEVDASGAVADDVAADRAMGQVVRDGLYGPRTDTRFELEFSWDSVSEMASFMKESRRMRQVRPSYADLEKVHREWRARSGGRVRLRYWRTMLLAVYQKATKQALEHGALPHAARSPGRPVGSLRGR